MDPIKKNDSGAAVEDVQHRLVKAGYLAEDQVTGTFGAETENAVLSLCRDCGIEPRAEVDNAVWTKLVDASFELGDRNLFLRVPFFHGADVRTLQEALSALGFSCGIADGIFGVHTEDALRRFQLNMGLPTDGIAGAFTFLSVFSAHRNSLVRLLLVCRTWRLPLLRHRRLPAPIRCWLLPMKACISCKFWLATKSPLPRFLR